MENKQALEFALDFTLDSFRGGGDYLKPKPYKTHITEQKQRKILEVANEFFLKYGYKKTSLQMIVKQTGGSLATIYKVFGNKEDLFQKVIEFNGQKFIETMNQIFIQNMDSDLNLNEYLYNIGLHLIREVLKANNIAFLRLMILEGYGNQSFIETFRRSSDSMVFSIVSQGIKHYNSEQSLNLKDEEIERCARLFIHLIIESYWFDSLLDSNYQPPKDDKIQEDLKRAVKFFMLYLKYYKEI